ncbi:MAG: AAA family ATPase [Bacillota bacterium]
MRYIKKIILENFQSHKYSEVEFGPELNVIVGPSDSGKSSIIRALKWVMYNEPAGDFFIREGEKECTVTLILSDGTQLQRYRTRSKNGYRLIDNKGEESRFEGIGSTVPQEVTDVTGIRKIQLDSDSTNAINLGEQLEGAFLLTEKSSTRANAIGRLVGVDIVDDALRDVLRDVRLLSQTRKQREDALQETIEKIDKYNYIDNLKEIHEKTFSIMEKVSKHQNQIEALDKLNRKFNALKYEISRTEKIINSLRSTEKLQNLFWVIESSISNYTRYTKYHDFITNNKYESTNLNIILDSLSDIHKTSPMELSIELLIIRHDRLEKLRDQLNSNTRDSTIIDQMTKKLVHVEKTFEHFESSKEKYNKLKELEKISIKYRSIISSNKKGAEYVERLNYLVENDKKFDIINNKANMLHELNKNYIKLETIARDINKTQESIISNQDFLNEILDNYRKLLQEIEKCPFCLGDIDDNTIDHIITYHLGG